MQHWGISSGKERVFTARNVASHEARLTALDAGEARGPSGEVAFLDATEGMGR